MGFLRVLIKEILHIAFLLYLVCNLVIILIIIIIIVGRSRFFSFGIKRVIMGS